MTDTTENTNETEASELPTFKSAADAAKYVVTLDEQIATAKESAKNAHSALEQALRQAVREPGSITETKQNKLVWSAKLADTKVELLLGDREQTNDVLYSAAQSEAQGVLDKLAGQGAEVQAALDEHLPSVIQLVEGITAVVAHRQGVVHDLSKMLRSSGGRADMPHAEGGIVATPAGEVLRAGQRLAVQPRSARALALTIVAAALNKALEPESAVGGGTTGGKTLRDKGHEVGAAEFWIESAGPSIAYPGLGTIDLRDRPPFS